MRTIYIDAEHKCHLTDDGTMIAIETEYFDGKCNTYVEGYCWEVREDGFAVYPWKPHDELDVAQRLHERHLIEIYEKSLKTVGVVL